MKERIADGGKITGIVNFKVIKADGSIRQQWNENKVGKFLRKLGMEMRVPFLFGQFANDVTIRNLVTSAGKAGVASRINGSGGEVAFTYLAVGTGTGAAAIGDTTLGTETATSGLSRAAATCTRVTTTVTNDTAQLDKTFTVTGTVAVTEVGAFNAASSGVLLGRQVFSAINVVNGDTLQIIYKFAVS